MEPEKEFFRTLPRVGENLTDRIMILANCVAARLRPIEPQPFFISAVIVDRSPVGPLAPVPPGRWAVMMPGPHDVMETNGSHIVHHSLARLEHDASDLID